jgi:hypothetical protein
MGSSTPSFGFFDPVMLATLEQTFNAAWPLLEAQEPFLASEKEAELKLGLSQTLVALVADGVTDADELQKLALARLPLTWLGTEGGGCHGFGQSDI